MNRKLLVIPVLIAILFALMPMQSTYAVQAIAWEPISAVTVGGMARTGRITVRLSNQTGADVTTMEISPAGANQWVRVVNGSQAMGVFQNNSFQLFNNVIYGGVNTFDFRLNGVLWSNVKVDTDTDIVFGYDYEPYIVSSLLTRADYK